MTDIRINVHEELADAPLTPLHRRLGVLMALLTLFDGYDTFNPAYVIHYVAGPWGLAPSQIGFLVSSGLIGFLIGALGHGLVADRWGRRVTLIGGLWVTSIFTLLTPVLGDGFWSFCAIRLVTGLGLGVLLPLATTYINELAPRRSANTFALLGVGLGWAAGGTVASLIGVFVTPILGWHSLYWFGALSFVLLAFLQVTLPESVKFLLRQGRTDEVKALLSQLRPDRAAVYAHATLTPDPPRPPGNTIAVLLGPRYRRTSLTIWASAFLSLFCLFGLTGWIPTVMIGRGETFAASFGFGALMQVMSFLGGMACGHLVDRKGYAAGWLAAFWFLGGVAVLALAVANGHILNVTAVAAAGFFIIGAQFVLNNVTAQAYDTGVRATAVGTELGVGRVGAILGPAVAGVLQQAFGPTAMFVAIGCAAILAAITILTLPRVGATEMAAPLTEF